TASTPRAVSMPAPTGALPAMRRIAATSRALVTAGATNARWGRRRMRGALASAASTARVAACIAAFRAARGVGGAGSADVVDPEGAALAIARSGLVLVLELAPPDVAPPE